MRECVIHDAMGQRIAKTVTNKNTTDGTDKFVTTYYVRDPQGNVLAVYEHKHGDSGNGTFTLTEQHLYGTGRLGMKKRDLALNVANASEPTPVTHYELTNHLGNVMAVISDKASDTNEPTVVSLSDYYPYGMTEPGRSWNAGDYRFGYTGHEKESDLAEGVYTTEYRLLDTRLGRWMRIDNCYDKYPNKSPYSYALCSPIQYVDSNGDFVEDSEGRIIFTIESENEWIYIPGKEYAYKGTIGYVMTNKGIKVKACIATDNTIYILAGADVEKKTLDYKKIEDQSPYDNSYNCTGNAMGKKSFNISSYDIDEDVLSSDGYKKIKLEDAKAGDILTYTNPKTGKIEHFEYFEEDGKVSTKGGIAKDNGLAEPGAEATKEGGDYYNFKVSCYRHRRTVKESLINVNKEYVEGKNVVIISNEDFEAIQKKLSAPPQEFDNSDLFNQHKPSYGPQNFGSFGPR